MNTLTISWDGATYKVEPTMKLLASIEMDHGVSIVGLAVELNKSQVPPFAAVSVVIAAVLQSAGAEITADQIWAKINDWESDDNGAVLALNLITAIIDAFNPEPPERIKTLVKGKKPRAAARKRAAK